MKHRIAVPAVVAVAFAATACSHTAHEDRTAFQWTNQLPAGAVVHLRDGTGDITVRRAAGQNVVVNGTRRWRRGRASDIRFTVTQVGGNEYYVCAMWSASGKCGEKGYRGRQTGGFLTMFSLFHRTSDAAADFVAEIPANVVLDAKTANGSVQVDGMTAGVTAHTANGTVTASNVSGPLALTTTNGDVRLSTDSLAAADSIHLTTTNGTIRAEIPAGLQGAFDLSVMNGSVRTELPIPAAPKSHVGKHLIGQIGTSTRVVKMRTMNGNVSVVTRRLPASH